MCDGQWIICIGFVLGVAVVIVVCVRVFVCIKVCNCVYILLVTGRHCVDLNVFRSQEPQQGARLSTYCGKSYVCVCAYFLRCVCGEVFFVVLVALELLVVVCVFDFTNWSSTFAMEARWAADALVLPSAASRPAGVD